MFLRLDDQHFKKQTIRGHAFRFIKIPSKQLEISLPMFFAVQTEEISSYNKHDYIHPRLILQNRPAFASHF